MKTFLSYKDQIALLKRKKLNIQDEARAIATLKQTSYFALINGYKKIFKDNNGNYKPNTQFEHIVSLYNFDMQLSDLFFKYILIFERQTKSHISYHFSDKYRNAYHDYLNVVSYDYTDENKRMEIIRFINDLDHVLQKGKAHDYIKHYKKKHNGEIPLWVLVKAMTLGQISKMYSLFEQPLQDAISSEYGLTNSQLESVLKFLTYFRNVCAHNERLYNYHTRQEIPLALFNNLNISSSNPQRKKLFSVAVCLKHVLTSDKFTAFLSELQQVIDNLSLDGCPVSKNQILSDMGFDADWDKYF